MIRILPGLLVLVLMPVGSVTAAAGRELGIETEAYPTGVITAVGAKIPLENPGRWLTLRVGYNDTHREDNGDRDDEKGDGVGFSIGWRTMLRDAERGWFAGAGADLWFMEIDWIDDPGTPAETRGRTDITVLQPTAEFGYRLPFGGQRHWTFEPTVSLGVEWNINTDGADVGQGLILRVGGAVFRRF